MTENIETLSLGQQLKTAREALGLSFSDVAQKTNLKRSHIEAIENDIFILKSVPPAFVRGYVRNYVRFLQLPESLINSVHYGEVTIPKEAKKVSPILTTNPKSQTRWVKVITWLVLLSAAGMTLMWWWQEHKKDEDNREAIVNTAISPKNDNSEINLNTTLTRETSFSNNEGITNTEQATETHSNNANGSIEPVTVRSDTTDITTEIQITPTEATDEPVNVLQQKASLEAENTENSETLPTENPTMITADLQIEITSKESWITVRGDKNKRLAEKLYKAGDVLKFNDNTQYRLTVGAPANVKIYYKGEIVPLKVDGRVARFKLPLAN